MGEDIFFLNCPYLKHIKGPRNPFHFLKKGLQKTNSVSGIVRNFYITFWKKIYKPVVPTVYCAITTWQCVYVRACLRAATHVSNEQGSARTAHDYWYSYGGHDCCIKGVDRKQKVASKQYRTEKKKPSDIRHLKSTEKVYTENDISSLKRSTMKDVTEDRKSVV